MTNTKKMATLGLYMFFIGGLISVIGGFIYNKNKDKSGGEKHSQLVEMNDKLGKQIDTAENNISKKIDSITSQKKTKPVIKKETTGNMASGDNNKQHYVGRDNYGINGDVNINAEKNFGKPEQDQLMSIINENKEKHNITSNIAVVNLYTQSSDKVFHQVIEFLTSKGYEVYTNISTGGGAPKGIVVQVADNKTIVNVGDL
ncbi:MAG TPA: hypothetical protein VFN30_03945 [Chitinophagaceae bacterium]|nr:hypothetical protein [Chitinophagaceae bacterium]